MNTTHLAFIDEMGHISKEAGPRAALSVALTGRVPIYHGTSKALGRKALKQGLRPQAATGVSDMLGLSGAEKGLSFVTRSPSSAKNYAMQAKGIERFGKLKSTLGRSRRIRQKVEGIPEEARPALSLAASRMLGAIPGGRAVVRGSVPRGTLRRMEGGIPELATGNMANARAGYRHLGPQGEVAEQFLTGPFLTAMSLKGGLPAKFIKGSPQYQGLSLKELADHARSIGADPKEYAKDVLRALTGFSHRPATILRKADQAVGL